MYLNEFDATMKLIQGKWKIMILYELYESKTVRFNELQKYIEQISHKTLTNQLRELEQDQLIQRKIFKEVPPHVEYSLTESGKSMIPVLDVICNWGLEHISHDKIHRNNQLHYIKYMDFGVERHAPTKLLLKFLPMCLALLEVQ